MKVIAAINGTITAESMAFYALKYAQVQNLTLVLLHIVNKKDSLDDVESSIERIGLLATSEGVQVEKAILYGDVKKALFDYLGDNHTDVVFCSTRKEKKFIVDSFSDILVKMNLSIDIAVVRIVKMNYIKDPDKIILSIKKDKLSVKKFAFFSTLASSYKADSEIYSVSNMSRFQLARIGIHEVKDMLSKINYNLRHYIKLAQYMPFTLHIKHDFTQDETRSILTHIAKSNAKLVIIGAKRLSVVSFFTGDIPIEKLMREASVNTIAYYTKED